MCKTKSNQTLGFLETINVKYNPFVKNINVLPDIYGKKHYYKAEKIDTITCDGCDINCQSVKRFKDVCEIKNKSSIYKKIKLLF